MPPAARRVRVRTYDPARSRAALTGQAEALRTAVHRLCAHADADDLLAGPTRLGEWRVRELVAHLGSVFDAVTDNLGLPAGDGAPLSPTDWVSATRGGAPDIAAAAGQRTGQAFAGTPAQVSAPRGPPLDRCLAVLADDHAPGLLIPTCFGPMLLSDHLVTRLVETVVHADDLADATAPGSEFPHDRQALAACTRLLADALAVQAPGGAVELRVPPFAVVQCVEGPRHTRGTPPNVVETSPLTWIRLATGRLEWARALDVAQLTASGERSDLSRLLPVMG
jgi:uncharacterized protein (TIGR03083 family)